MYEKVETLFTV